MLDKSYDELIKEEEYRQLANILLSDECYRNNNALCIQRFYQIRYGVTLDHAVSRYDLPSIFTIERKIRKLKQVNHALKGNNQSQEDFKEINREIPLVVKLF